MVSFWTRLPHCSGVESDEGVESYLKTTHHPPVDRYGQVGRALCPYSSGLRVHARELLVGLGLVGLQTDPQAFVLLL